MVLKPIRGKRGTDTILYFRIICVVIAVGLFIIILSFVIEASKNTIIKKNYGAKDIALLITTLYASPGDASYEYPLSALKGDFTIKIGNGLVSVSDPKGKYDYWYSRPKNVYDIDITGKNPNGEVIIKNEDGLFVIKPPLGGRKIIFTKSRELTEKRKLTAEVVQT
jgi:hypothetical protein